MGLPPQVIDVIISGSNSQHAPHSLAAQIVTGNQLLTVPVGHADTVSIAFTEDVNVVSANLVLVGLYTAALPTIVDFSYDSATYTASWTMDGPLTADQYALVLQDDVTDVDGNRLDGEWYNQTMLNDTSPLVRPLPSGDGSAGGDFVFVTTILPYDFDQDNDVDLDDWMVQYGNLNNITFGALFADGDWNGDGAVDDLDQDNSVQFVLVFMTQLSILADIDGDFDVDSDDLSVISSNFGMTDATYADGDLNGDGTVDLDDLDLAFAQYGLSLLVA